MADNSPEIDNGRRGDASPSLRGRDLFAIPAVVILEAPIGEVRRYAESIGMRDRQDKRQLTSLPWLSAQVLGVRLSDDSRDTGRIRRMFKHPSPVVRAACLTSPRLPRAARRALVGLSPVDERQYGRATAWELYYLARNPELHAEELRAIVNMTYTRDANFWPSVGREPGNANQRGEVTHYIARRWQYRRQLQEDVVFRVLEHPKCPIDLLGWALEYYVAVRQPGRLDEPRLLELVNRLSETAAGRERLVGTVEYLMQHDPENTARWVLSVQQNLLTAGKLGRIEIDHLFRFGDIDMLIGSLGRGVPQHASDIARAILIQRVAEERPHLLPQVWDLEGAMAAATLASLDRPDAKVKAAERPDLPQQFRKALDRWAVSHPEEEAAHQIAYNLSVTRFHEDPTERTTRRIVDWAKRRVDPNRKALWDSLMEEVESQQAARPRETDPAVSTRKPASRRVKEPSRPSQPPAKGGPEAPPKDPKAPDPSQAPAPGSEGPGSPFSR